MEENVQTKTKKPIYKKWWFWAIVIVAIVIISASAGGSETDDSGSTGTNSSVTYETVDLQTMLDDLESNALKAEKTYMNKYVEVVGKIVTFDSDGSYISIEPTNADEWNFDTVTCKIKNDAQLDFLLEKSVGDKVTVKGKITQVGEILGYTIKIEEIK
jgi:RecJ-like exonuclease